MFPDPLHGDGVAVGDELADLIVDRSQQLVRGAGLPGVPLAGIGLDRADRGGHPPAAHHQIVGVGVQRVRQLSEEARKFAPSIIFVDEFDTIGRARSGSLEMGSNTEQEQTLNQILTEMDGFSGVEGVVVLAATDRADVLDPALTRDGRFDRKITASAGPGPVSFSSVSRGTSLFVSAANPTSSFHAGNLLDPARAPRHRAAGLLSLARFLLVAPPGAAHELARCPRRSGRLRHSFRH